MGLMLRISCPKLVFMKLAGSLAWEFLFENLDSLKKAVIHIRDFFEDTYPTLEVFYELFHVESLSISLYCVGKCCHPQPGDLLDLPYLKTLELTVDDAMYVFIPFLQSFPDLESLHLIFIKYVYGLGDLNLEEPETISLLTRVLKKVEFLEFDEEKPKLAVARALLEHGNLLEEMVFSWGDEGRFHERSMETMKEVSKFHKASSTVKLKFVFKPRQVDPIPAPKLLGSDSAQVESSMCESNSSINMPGS
ncbi:hypothetical protein L1887_37272 [Cichorium endivia]|nr:hypothetical protein L1887_37272 [Cichorium endivia]